MPNIKSGSAAIVLSALCAVSAAQAQLIHRCVDGDAVSYQSAPCVHGAASRIWEYTPESQPSAELQARLDAISRELSQRNRPLAVRVSRTAQATRPRQKISTCERARARQQASLDRLQLRRTHDQLRRLEDEVTRHCR